MKIRTGLLCEAPKVRKLWACFGVLPLLFFTPASAQSLAGVWSSSNVSPYGARTVQFFRFNSNGAVQLEMGASNSQGGGSVIVRCQGAYQFNGQTVAMRWSACQSCGGLAGCTPTNMVPGGPFYVRFMDNYTVDIGGEVYHRQQ